MLFVVKPSGGLLLCASLLLVLLATVCLAREFICKAYEESKCCPATKTRAISKERGSAYACIREIMNLLEMGEDDQFPMSCCRLQLFKRHCERFATTKKPTKRTKTTMSAVTDAPDDYESDYYEYDDLPGLRS